MRTNEFSVLSLLMHSHAIRQLVTAPTKGGINCERYSLSFAPQIGYTRYLHAGMKIISCVASMPMLNPFSSPCNSEKKSIVNVVNIKARFHQNALRTLPVE